MWRGDLILGVAICMWTPDAFPAPSDFHSADDNDFTPTARIIISCWYRIYGNVYLFYW